jgi:hypothetical protein
MIEVKHHLFSIFSLDVDCIISCIKPFFVDLSNIGKGDIKIIKGLIFICLDTHMVK